MKQIKQLTSACRYCRYYQPEGRRGGTCQRLGAPVFSHWKACNLALPPFAPSWESLENAWNLTEPIQVIPLPANLEKVPSIYAEAESPKPLPTLASKTLSFANETKKS